MLDSIVIICDTREHQDKNNHILNYFDAKNIPWKKMKLPYGDYSFMVPADNELGIPRDLYFDKKCVIERKANLEEFSGNVTSNSERSRVKKELALAPPKKVIIIENGSYGDVIDGNYNTKYDSKSYWATIHSFWHEFDVPFVFMKDSKYTGVFIRGFFTYYLRQIVKH